MPNEHCMGIYANIQHPKLRKERKYKIIMIVRNEAECDEAKYVAATGMAAPPQGIFDNGLGSAALKS